MRLPGWRRRDEELEDEIQAHLRMAVQDRVERGETPEQAEASARREFGNVALVKEVTRQMWGGGWLRQFTRDLGYGLRTLRRGPAFTAAAVLTLALGIGANTAIFSVVNAVVLRPLPYEDPDRLVTLWWTRPQQGAGQVRASMPDFQDWREQGRVFEGVAAFGSNLYNLTGAGEPEQVQGAAVSGDLFRLLGARAAHGRTPTPEENGQPFVVLSDAAWRRLFRADPAAVGKTVTLNGTNFTVTGVMPPGFEFPGPETAVWTTLSHALSGTPEQAASRTFRAFRVVARLKPGVALEEARAEMSLIASRLQQQYPEANGGLAVSVVPLHEQVVGNVRPALLVLLGAVAFVLLIACANVANLLLTRAVAREREFAVRAALGASRTRLIRQLLTESLLLALIGGAAGLLLALWGISYLSGLELDNIPRMGEVRADAAVFLFTLGAAALSGAVFGLAPALSTRVDLNASLKGSGRGAVGSRGGGRLRKLLVVSEVALSLVLLVGAGLMIRSFLGLLRIDPGFAPDNLLTMQLILPRSRYSDGRQINAFYQQVFERLGALPGVRAVGAGSGLPPVFNQQRNSYAVEGYQPSGSEVLVANYLPINSAYFRALGAPLVAGREFNERDAAEAPPVVIINQRLARRFFPGGDPVGRRLSVGGGTQWRTIVGVVGDLKYSGSLYSEEEDAIYVPYQQAPYGGMYLLVRAGPDAPNLLAGVRDAVWSVDGDVPIARVRTMEQVLAGSVARPRFYTLLLGAFAALALTLAAVGIYGVISYTVAQRTREIGIRLALGARAFDVLKLVVGEGMRMALYGVAAGLVAAFALARVMSGLLYGVSATDPLTYAGIAALLAAVALTACYIPARRAMRVDPNVALRYE